MSEEAPKESPTPRKRPRWRKKRWWFVVLLLGTLIWLDGPGWRWLGQRVANAYLPDMGYEASFQLEGRLTSGPIRVTGLELRSESVVHEAQIEGLEIRYSLLEAIKGKVEAIEARGIHVDVDLAALPPGEEKEPEEAKEPASLEDTLEKVRERLIPATIDIRNLSVRIRRGDELVFSLDPTNLLHESGSSDFRLELGRMDLPGDRTIPAQMSTISWSGNTLEVDQLALLEEVSVAGVSATLTGDPRYSGSLRIGKGRFDVTTNLDTVDLSMTGEALGFDEIERIAKIEIPVDGTITGLSAEVSDFTEDPLNANADLTITLADFNYDEWRSEEIQLQAKLNENQATARIEMSPAGSPTTIEASATIDRANKFLPTDAQAQLQLREMRDILTVVRDRYKPSEEAPAPPNGLFMIDASSTFAESGQPEEVKASISITPEGAAPPISIEANYQPKQGVDATVGIPNFDLTAGFEPESMVYQGTAQLREFSPESLSGWLLPFGIEVPAGMKGSLGWKGGGNITDKTHEGLLEIGSFEWMSGDPEELPPVLASGTARYAWPESVELDNLEVKSGDQSIVLDAELADNLLTLEQLRWSEGESILANGTASIPLAENPADWRGLLKQTRPIELDLSTPTLPLSKLHRFLPEDVRFPESSTGLIKIDLSGTPADPILDARIEAKNVGLTSQDQIPPADFQFLIKAAEKTMKLDGEIVVPGYPKATINGVTSWVPGQWALEPESAKEAPLDAELRVADFNLAPFTSRVPGARQVSGLINLTALVSGTVAEPLPSAKLTLRDGGIEWQKAGAPDVRSASMEIDVTEDRVEIKSLDAIVSAGTVSLKGTLALEKFKPSEVDLDLDIEAIPAVRDDSTIVRLSTDLSLTGPWESANLSGSVSIVDSLLFKDFEILPIGGPVNPTAEPSLPSVDSETPAEKLAAIPEPFRNWGLDVKLATSTPFLIRGNLAGGEVYVDARVGGTVGKPRPTGGVKLREVTAQLPFSTLTVPMGEVKFNPDRPFNPTLDIKGESTVRPYDIELRVYGGLANPKILASSNPPLPESDIMTLIATGTTTEGLADPTAATARAAQLVIEELRRGRIGAMKSLRPIFKVLDKVDFQVGEQAAYSSTTFNSVTFNLDENWLLTAGVSDEGYTRAKVTYLFRFR